LSLTYEVISNLTVCDHTEIYIATTATTKSRSSPVSISITPWRLPRSRIGRVYARDIEACLRAQHGKLYHMGIRGPVYQARQNKVEIQDVCPKLSEKSVTPKSNFFNDDCLTMYSLPYVVFWRICHNISQLFDK
jgi:hypothetical protein